MKKKVLLSSIMTIALCLSLIAGSTFALFTSTSTQDIAINSGKVQMTANIEGLKLYSVQGNPDVADEDAVIDEKGNKYEYVEQTNGEFANGGTAAFDATEAKLTMERVTPGDKVEMTLTGANTSNVAIQYRYSIKCTSGHALMEGFNVYLAEGTNTLVKYEALSSYVTGWRNLAAETDMADVAIVIELPVTAGNEYQDLNAEIEITVEAVQGNAVTQNEAEIVYYYVETPVVEAATDNTLDPPAETYMYKDMYLLGEANIVVSDPTKGVHLDNVTADVKGSAIVIGEMDQNPVIIIENCDFILDAGEYIIDASAIGSAYQVFLVNVTVNGELLPVGVCDANVGAYLNCVQWFQVVDPTV